MIYILSSLAYGDFVIDCFAASHLGSNFTIIAPYYLKPLHDAIEFKGTIDFIDIASSNIPPDIFNVKQKGFLSAIKSTIKLRSSLSFYKKQDALIYFHHNDIRWRIINFPMKFHFLRDGNQDIYEAYANLFNVPDRIPQNFNPNDVIYIFPESRQLWKKLPENILFELITFLKYLGIKYKIVIQNENTFQNRYDFERVSSISEVVDIIKISSVIISVDSLPAHLAYYYSKNLFIYTPDLLINKAVPPYVKKNNFISEFSDPNHISKIKTWLSKISI